MVCKSIYIAPQNETDRCKQHTQKCFTLKEFQFYVQNVTSDITLTFLSGEHFLSWNMMFNRPTVTLKASMENRTQIKCQNSSARISLNQVWYAIIENLEFSGCETDELILVNSVQNLSIIGCYFMNNDCPCGVLSISNTRKVVITNSSFVGNKAQNESIIHAVAVKASYIIIMIVESSKFMAIMESSL